MLLCLTVAPAAHGATTPKPVSLSDVKGDEGHITAMLTVPAGEDTVVIDPRSIRATVGGKQATVSVEGVQHERRSTVLLIDTSGSMGRDGIAAAIEAARTFLKQAPSDLRVGLATFADKPEVLVGPTTDRRAVLEALPALQAKGETALYDGLQRAAKALGPDGSRTIIVLSDGGDTVSKSNPKLTLKVLTSHGIRTEAVAFHTVESQFAALRTIVKGTQGHLVQADDPKALRAAFASAAKALAGQVRVKVTVPPGVSGNQALRITGRANGAPIAAGVATHVSPSTRVPSSVTSPAPRPSVAEVAPAVPAPKVAATPWLSAGWIWVAVGAVFAGLLIVSLLATGSAFTPEARRRIRSLDEYVGTVANAKTKATKSGTSGIAAGVLRVSDAWAKRHDSSAKTAVLLERADLPLRVGEWYVLRVVAVIVTFTVAWLGLRSSIIGSLVALVVSIVVGLGASLFFLRFKAARRASKFDTQLPDVLTLIASSLSTGFSLAQAVDAVTRDAAEPSAKEFSRALAETRIGADLEDSLERMASRMGSTNLEWTTMAIRIQRQVGGNLAETLRTTAGTIRERESLVRQIRALSADGRLSAYILVALPIGLLLYMLLVNRDYISLLWTTGMGLLMVTGGTVSLLFGMFWMSRVVKVEV
jgi:tight adherence protein B